MAGGSRSLRNGLDHIIGTVAVAHATEKSGGDEKRRREEKTGRHCHQGTSWLAQVRGRKRRRQCDVGMLRSREWLDWDLIVPAGVG